MINNNFENGAVSFEVKFNEMQNYPDSVKFSPQTLTEEQKAQARKNIGAAASEEDNDEKYAPKEHAENNDIHITSDERRAWNEKAEKKDIPESLPASDVYDWAKQSKKPKYTADEVGALPSTYTPPKQTAEQVGADPAGTAAGAVSSHNTATDAHNDIRLLISNITTLVNNLLDADDETLNQTSEIVEYIKDNRGLIEQITTGKVNTSDIIDNLTTSVSNKPLSANQGVVLKGLIDTLQAAVNAITIPSKLSHLENDAGFITAAVNTLANYYTKTVIDGLLAQLKTEAAENAASGVSTHNVDTASHNDIRLLIEGLTARLNALANSDDTTLDQMAEVVDYIKDNRELIEQITTGKVSVADIIDNLTTNVSNKPLSAAQGVALKALIDALQTSLTSHSGNSTIHITAEERTKWNSKVSSTELTSAVETALNEAKASGEFKGEKGDKGDKGDTPQKGIDYYTASDKTEMVNMVLAALPTWTGGTY